MLGAGVGGRRRGGVEGSCERPEGVERAGQHAFIAFNRLSLRGGLHVAETRRAVLQVAVDGLEKRSLALRKQFESSLRLACDEVEAGVSVVGHGLARVESGDPPVGK